MARFLRFRRLPAVVAVAVLLSTLSPAAASAADPGPALTVPTSVLDAALECDAGIDRPGGTPVLLVHGTSSTPEESWGFGYRRVLPTRGHPVCTVRLPGRAWDDLQVSTEYVVRAIRRMSERSGRRIAVLGHSQGTLQPLWALRFWPDLAGLVDDYVGLAPPLRGTVAAGLVCAVPGRCPAAVWQFSAGSNFIRALNRDALPAGPSYTSIATLVDELVVPQPGASRGAGITTVHLQQICPGRVVEHVGMLGDAVAFALVVDALDHPGPASASRVARSVCAAALMPGIDVAGYTVGVPVLVANFVSSAPASQWATAEPALRAYATA